MREELTEGESATAALHPVEGRERVACVLMEIACGLVEIATKAPGLTILERTVNGQPSLVMRQDGVTVTVMAFDIAGDRITARDPGRLIAGFLTGRPHPGEGR
ncbi:hypothetical protein ABT297_34735 [Dactylosporangium sp. NPDC000555]|uniref:hypothetical protein n=1 Tax=Dactylosporangium sp. NPDC000555 TaxID=3154260 RepID=UPI0033303A40